MILGSSPLGTLWHLAFAVFLLSSCTNSYEAPLTALLLCLFNHLVKQSSVVCKFRKGVKKVSHPKLCLLLTHPIQFSQDPCITRENSSQCPKASSLGKKQTQVLAASSFFSYPCDRDRCTSKICKVCLFRRRWDLSAPTQRSERNAVTESGCMLW